MKKGKEMCKKHEPTPHKAWKHYAVPIWTNKKVTKEKNKKDER